MTQRMKCLGLHPYHQEVYGPERAYCERKGCQYSRAFAKEDRTKHEILMYEQLMTRKRKERQKNALKANLALLSEEERLVLRKKNQRAAFLRRQSEAQS